VKRIALYYPWIYVRGGAERVIVEIARRTRHRYTIFTNHVDYGQTFPEVRALENLVVLGPPPVPVGRSFAQVARAATRIARQKLDLREFDALVVASEGLGDFITFRNHAKPVACVCFTPARPVYDPEYRRAWLARRPAMRLPLALFSLAYAWLTRRAWRHYDRVFADSNEVRTRILRGRLCPPEKVEVLYPGVDAAAIRPSFTHDRSFLYAGRIKWTKNVELAIAAFRAFRARTADTGAWRLVIAGGVDSASGEYVAALRQRAGPDGTVTFVANPSDAELAALYARCCALIFPALNEDWGIVPLEAMAHGKPVLAVNRGGPAESVVHGETGFLLEPTPEAFAAQLDWLACHPAETERLGRRAAERAASFSWDRFVTRLDDYFERDR
jgi:glycosyltransferase involved in cell wall biosynthesis